jgi:ryanodine receptor 2
LEQSIASLDTLIADVDKFIEEGKSHTEAPHIIDVILPFLCSYLPAWWHRGPGRLIYIKIKYENIIFSKNKTQLCKQIPNSSFE